MANLFTHMEMFLIYDSSNKILIGSKLLRIRFDKIDGFIRIYDFFRIYLVLLGPVEYDAIYNTIRLLLSIKVASQLFFNYYPKIKVDFCDSLSIKKDSLCIML